MKWTGGTSFSSHVTQKVVIAVAAFIVCPCMTIESSAQTASVVLHAIETEHHDPAPEDADKRPKRLKRIDGGILNLAPALSAALREMKLGESRAPENLGESRAPENDVSDDLLASVASGPSVASSSSGASATSDGSAQPLPDHALDQYMREDRKRNSFDWSAAFRQSMIFLGIEHAFRLATESATRAELKGAFFKDYFKAVRSLRGWDDGDPFLVNYIGHPMAGSVAGFIQVHNDPKGARQEVSLNKSYWRSRLKAFGWSFAYSTQFELGLFSEAALGNIGIRPYGKARHPMAYVDLVVTPVVGTGWLVGEDMLDRYLIRRLEDNISSRVARLLIRTFLNPSRSFANLLRGQRPWYRDNRQ